MSPRDALNLLDANVANLNGSREAHFNLQTAISVLRGVIDQAEQKAEMAGEALPEKEGQKDNEVEARDAE